MWVGYISQHSLPCGCANYLYITSQLKFTLVCFLCKVDLGPLNTFPLVAGTEALGC